MKRKLALIIGNGDYENEKLSKLSAPDVDVRALSGVLQDPEIGGFDSVKILQNETLRNVSREISLFFQNKSSSDLLLIYFSGHGVLDASGRLYLALKDTESEPALLRSTALSSQFIKEEMDECFSKQLIFILDCCHSGAFERAKSKLGSSVNTQSAFEGQGRAILTASDSTQYAIDGNQINGEASPSVFTQYIIEGLKTGLADIDGDGLISTNELYEFAYNKVLLDERTKQTPLQFSRLKGNLYIARNRKGPKSPAIKSEATEPKVKSINSPFQLKFMHIPTGTFFMGVNPEDAEKIKRHNVINGFTMTPQEVVHVNEFYISRYPITNAQYEVFARSSKEHMPAHWKWTMGIYKIPSGKADHPVVGVSQLDAEAFCRWLSTKTNLPIRLPVEVEWEKAARGTDARCFPWGMQFDKNKLNFIGENLNEVQTSPIGKYSPEGDSPYGVGDMAGNIWEWCIEEVLQNLSVPYAPVTNHPGNIKNGFLRGGNSSISRGAVFMGATFMRVGFRVVFSV